MSARALTVRLLLVDDSPLVRAGIRAVLEAEEDLVVAAEAGSVAEARAAVARTACDVALIDLRLPDGPGTSLLGDFARERPAVHCLVLTSSADPTAIRAALDAGAHGYLLKENDGATLASAIRRVARGETVLDPTLGDSVAALLRRRPSSEAAARLDLLAPQERRVVELLATGLTNKEIAAKLELSEKTVKNYLANAFDKLAVTGRVQAAALVIQTQRPATW